MRSPSRMEGNNFFSKRRLNCTTLVYTKVYHFPNNFRVYVWNAGIRNEITPSRFYLLNIGIGIKDSLWWKPKLFPGNILIHIHIPISATKHILIVKFSNNGVPCIQKEPYHTPIRPSKCWAPATFQCKELESSSPVSLAGFGNLLAINKRSPTFRWTSPDPFDSVWHIFKIKVQGRTLCSLLWRLLKQIQHLLMNRKQNCKKVKKKKKQRDYSSAS